MTVLKLSKSDPYTGNAGQSTHGHLPRDARDKANESAHWFVTSFVEKDVGC